jgi:uncharacterized repeat protein (TIGR02543 family)
MAGYLAGGRYKKEKKMKPKKGGNYSVNWQWTSSVLILVLGVFCLLAACGGPNSPGTTEYTVSFEANGGSPAPEPQTVAEGDKATEPEAMTKTGIWFGGWYTEAACTDLWDFDSDTVTGNTTLYAKWTPPETVPGANYNAKMRWLVENVQNGGDYIIEIDSDVSSIPLNFNKKYIRITLKGIGEQRIISSGITIARGFTLNLEENLEIRGQIQINSGGNLILNSGVKVTGGVNVAGTFIRNGVNVVGTFTMNGGEISDNTTGFGVSVDSYATFTMNGGEISGNSSSNGGGVSVAVDATFTMNGGEISGNGTSNSSGGVYVLGTFTMSGGEISGNIAWSGGGVYVGYNRFGAGTFIMNDGKISGNTAAGSYSDSWNGNGGGVLVFGGTFTMSGGEISGNTVFIYPNSSDSAGYGGGVYVGGSVFNKTGGTIFGYSEGDDDSNTVMLKSYPYSEGVVQNDNRGHAVYAAHSNSIFTMGKDTTSGPGDNMSYASDGTDPPTYSGDWDF